MGPPLKSWPVRGQAWPGPCLGPAPPALSIRAPVWVARRTSLRERNVFGASRCHRQPGPCHVDIAWTGVDRRRQARVWDLRPPLFPSAPSFGWTDAPASANGKFLVRHASRHPSWAATTFCPGCLQPTRDFRFALQRTTQYRGLDFCTFALL